MKKILRVLLVTLLSFFLFSCGGGKSVKRDHPAAQAAIKTMQALFDGDVTRAASYTTEPNDADKEDSPIRSVSLPAAQHLKMENSGLSQIIFDAKNTNIREKSGEVALIYEMNNGKKVNDTINVVKQKGTWKVKS